MGGFRFDYTIDDLRAFEKADLAQTKAAQSFSIPDSLKAPDCSAHRAGTYTSPAPPKPPANNQVGLPEIKASRNEGQPGSDSHGRSDVWRALKGAQPSGSFIVQLARGKYLGRDMSVVPGRIAAHRLHSYKDAETALMEFADAFYDSQIPPHAKVRRLK